MVPLKIAPKDFYHTLAKQPTAQRSFHSITADPERSPARFNEQAVVRYTALKV